MPLTASVTRREIHDRVIHMKAYSREDGLYDIEAHLVDTKPFAFRRISTPEPLPAGDPLHDMRVRLTVDDQYIVREVEAASDATPFDLCKEAESTLSVLVGERIGSGWSAKVKQHLRGAASCTHLMEMLIPMATTAYQGIRALRRDHSVPVDLETVRVELDSCYAYGRNREVVRMFWPNLYRQQNISSTE